MPKALLSVYDKTGIVEFGKQLLKLGYQLISTGGTYQILKENGLEVTKVDEITGFPEILEGRVKTLHPRIHGGILAKRNIQHLEELREHRIDPIDLVAVNLYPFETVVSKNGVTLDEALENIDIGGPAMVRAAAKNFEDVVVVVDPKRYLKVIDRIKADSMDFGFRKELALEAFLHTSTYDAAIATYLSGGSCCAFSACSGKELRYGENPHQQAAIFSVTAGSANFYQQGTGLADISPLQGKPLSYNNCLDAYAAWGLVNEFAEPASTIIKHNNPCGVAIADDSLTAYKRALASDPVSAYGGIAAFNKTVEEDLAKELVKNFYEVIAAPAFTDESLKVFSAKPNLRLLPLDKLGRSEWEMRLLGNSMLVQQSDKNVKTYPIEVVTRIKPTPGQVAELLFANRVVKWVKSNAIVISKDNTAVGIGAGQMNRVGAAEIALKQAGVKAQNAVLASDAFLPFSDTVEVAAKHGIAAIIQPGGSVKDNEVIEKCNGLGLAMVFTGIRHFKH